MYAARRIISPFLAAFLVALGVFFIVEAVPQLAGYHTPVGVNYYIVSNELMRRPWNDPYIIGAAAVLLIIGVFLLLVGLRRPPRPMSLTQRSERVRVEFPRRHVHRVAESAAAGVDGVAAVRVAGRRNPRVTVDALADAPDDLATRVSEQVRERLAAFEPERPPRVRVRVKHARLAERTPRRSTDAAGQGGQRCDQTRSTGRSS